MLDAMPAGDEGGARTSRLIVTIIADPAKEMRSWTGQAGLSPNQERTKIFSAASSTGFVRGWPPGVCAGI